MNKVNVEHINTSITAINEKVTVFNMAVWLNFQNHKTMFDDKHAYYKIPSGCGTIGCVAGATALTDEFKRAGGCFTIKKDITHIQLDGETGPHAMALFWGCSEEDAYNICARPKFYNVDKLVKVSKKAVIAALEHLKKQGTTKGFITVESKNAIRFKKGTKIICPNCKCEIAEAKQDIPEHDARDSLFWEGNSIGLGQPMSCPECDTVYLNGVGRIHTDKGWL